MIFLSFDIEEFDVPKDINPNYEVNNNSFEISIYGTNRILDILKRENVVATFFCTAKFATFAPELIRRINQEGHEIASHGNEHSNMMPSDLETSKIILENIIGTRVYGYRQPRMGRVDINGLISNGYSYNASINPTYIPGRYMNLFEKRVPFKRNGILNIPSSVTPILRIPLFWCSLHVFPMWFYKVLCKWTLYKDQLLSLYFHPWEFYTLKNLKNISIPRIILINSGDDMCIRLTKIIRMFKKDGQQFLTYKQYLESYD